MVEHRDIDDDARLAAADVTFRVSEKSAGDPITLSPFRENERGQLVTCSFAFTPPIDEALAGDCLIAEVFMPVERRRGTGSTWYFGSSGLKRTRTGFPSPWTIDPQTGPRRCAPA